jgi:hypothetical protein
VAVRVAFNPNYQRIAQNDDWSCAPTSLRWALESLGCDAPEDWMENSVISEHVVSRELGLLNATGAGLAHFVRRHFGPMGFDANNEASISFMGAALEGDHAYPILIGGRDWNHWTAVRGYDAANDLLLLANPGDGWRGVRQTMSRAQFDQLGPFSMVRVFHPDVVPR